MGRSRARRQFSFSNNPRSAEFMGRDRDHSGGAPTGRWCPADRHADAEAMKTPFQLAYDAFHARLDEFLSAGHYGQWVLFHRDTLIAMSESRDALYQMARERNLSDEEILVDLIAPEA